LIAGLATEQEVSRVKLTATKEQFTVSKLTMQVNESGSYDDINTVKLYDTAGTALSDAMTLDSSGKAKFTNLSIVVPTSGGKVVVVKPLPRLSATEPPLLTVLPAPAPIPAMR